MMIPFLGLLRSVPRRAILHKGRCQLRCLGCCGREIVSGAATFLFAASSETGEEQQSEGKNHMATKKKSSGRRYGKAAGKTVASAMRRKKHGTLRSGKGGKGGKVTSRKQAIAIGLSEARKKGAKVPKKKAA